jgi:flagellar biosynthetic protein FliR
MIDAWLVGYLLVLARVAAFIGFLPVFGRRQLPATVKAGLAVALTVFWSGSPVTAAVRTPEDLAMATGTVALVREIIAGTVLAMLAGLILVPIRIAGAWIGQELGLQMGQLLDPTGTESVSEVAALFEVFGLILFFLLDLHHWALWLLHWSWLFLGSATGLLALPTGEIASVVGQLEEYGLLIAAPVAIALAVINFAVLFLNKASPSLNLFSVGAPLRLLSGLTCLVLFWPVIARNMAGAFDRMDQSLQEVLRMMPGAL